MVKNIAFMDDNALLWTRNAKVKEETRETRMHKTVTVERITLKQRLDYDWTRGWVFPFAKSFIRTDGLCKKLSIKLRNKFRLKNDGR